MGNRKTPCELDHNGECLVCDCWTSECAYQRYLNKDYKYETQEELERMFKKFDPDGLKSDLVSVYKVFENQIESDPNTSLHYAIGGLKALMDKHDIKIITHNRNL
jgi:hypothetical protein